MGCSGGANFNLYLPPGYPIIVIWNNENQNVHRIYKTVYRIIGPKLKKSGLHTHLKKQETPA